MKLLKTTSRVLKMDFEIKRQLVCVTKFGCMFQPLTCLFTTKPREFKLILICEISQIFVWRNKAFIFFQKSDIETLYNWTSFQSHVNESTLNIPC